MQTPCILILAHNVSLPSQVDALMVALRKSDSSQWRGYSVVKSAMQKAADAYSTEDPLCGMENGELRNGRNYAAYTGPVKVLKCLLETQEKYDLLLQKGDYLYTLSSLSQEEYFSQTRSAEFEKEMTQLSYVGHFMSQHMFDSITNMCFGFTPAQSDRNWYSSTATKKALGANSAETPTDARAYLKQHAGITIDSFWVLPDIACEAKGILKCLKPGDLAKLQKLPRGAAQEWRASQVSQHEQAAQDGSVYHRGVSVVKGLLCEGKGKKKKSQKKQQQYRLTAEKLGAMNTEQLLVHMHSLHENAIEGMFMRKNPTKRGYRPNKEKQSGQAVSPVKYSYFVSNATVAAGSSFTHKHTIPTIKKKVCLIPLEEKKRYSDERRYAWDIGSHILKRVDSDFAAGEYSMHVSVMDSREHQVLEHKDRDDISPQIIITMGDYSHQDKGWECQHSDGTWHEVDTRNRFTRLDGRLLHRMGPLADGKRFCLIFFKAYDRRMTACAPILGVPEQMTPVPDLGGCAEQPISSKKRKREEGD